MSLELSTAQISWHRFLLVNQRRYIPEADLKSLFLWYSLNEDLIIDNNKYEVSKQDGTLADTLKASYQILGASSSLKARIKKVPMRMDNRLMYLYRKQPIVTPTSLIHS